MGRDLLEQAAQVAPNEAAREAIVVGSATQLLDIYEIESPLREQVWQAVEEAARNASNEVPGAPPRWPQEWIDHVEVLAREMEARRLDPDRPGAWP